MIYSDRRRGYAMFYLCSGPSMGTQVGCGKLAADCSGLLDRVPAPLRTPTLPIQFAPSSSVLALASRLLRWMYTVELGSRWPQDAMIAIVIIISISVKPASDPSRNVASSHTTDPPCLRHVPAQAWEFAPACRDLPRRAASQPLLPYARPACDDISNCHHRLRVGDGQLSTSGPPT